MTSRPLLGVIAGTQKDTQLGQDFLHGLGWRTVGCATARTPAEQDLLQRRHSLVLQGLCVNALDEMVEQGAQKVVIYCSSLSTVVDLSVLRDACSLPLLTPLDYYADVARDHPRVAVLAANAVGLNGAMDALRTGRRDVQVIGMHDLTLVCALERGDAPAQAVGLAIARFVEHAARCCDAVLLACTHFPLIAEHIAGMTRLPVYHVNTWLARELRRTEEGLRAHG